MAILNQLVIGDILHLVIDNNPTTGGGLSAPIGSIAVFNNAGSSNTD